MYYNLFITKLGKIEFYSEQDGEPGTGRFFEFTVPGNSLEKIDICVILENFGLSEEVGIFDWEVSYSIGESDP